MIAFGRKTNFITTLNNNPMKNAIYVILFVIITGLAASCTDENIRPQTGNGTQDVQDV